MNFELKVPGGRKKKPNSKSSLGLNSRGDAGKNVFGDEDDFDQEDTTVGVGVGVVESQRDAVNRAIRKEQEATRKRAEQAMKNSFQQEETASIYDYDAQYESFGNNTNDKNNNNKNNKKRNGSGEEVEKEKKSRYISDLVKAAEERNYEREIALERKTIKEQEEEEQENAALTGKERFITAGYKRKLEERKLWKANRDKMDEQDQDVAKQHGTGLSNFYVNLSKNVAMGGPAAMLPEKTIISPADGERAKDKPSFLQGFGRAEGQPPQGEERGNTKTSSPHEEEQEILYLERRKQREQKLQKARERYFRRHQQITT